MATKRVANANKEAEIKTINEMSTQEAEKPKTTAKQATQKKVTPVNTTNIFDASEPIMCTSVTAGELIMIGKKTKNVYRWANYGDTEAVEYQDLQAAKLTKSRYIFCPLLMIENDEILKAWPEVQDIYNAVYGMNDISEIFRLDNTSFKNTLATLPVGFKNTLKTIAYDMVEDGTLDSLQKIKIMDEVLGTDIMTLIKE